MALRVSPKFCCVLLLLAATIPSARTLAQTPAPAPAQSPAAPSSPAPQSPAPDDAEPPRPKGQIIIQSHGEPPSGQAPTGAPTTPGEATAQPAEDAKVDVADAQRGALLFIGYDLDARLNLAQSGLNMRARVNVRNTGSTPLAQIALQVSSTLHWDSATLRGAPLPLAQHRVDTDADHTGAANEAVLSLPQPLAPGESASLDLFYSGTLAQNGGRLARLGANAAQQRSADWDGISPAWTGLRGFGNVLWYPVAAPQLFLAEGNTLFTAIGRARLRDETASMRLRLSVDYSGEPPVAAYFCGRREELKALADDPGAPTSTGNGVATADFSPQPLGFRLPSLFVIEQAETLVGGPGDTSVPVSSSSLDSSSDASSSGSRSSSGSSSSSSSSGNSSSPETPALRTRPQPVPSATDTAVIALASNDPGGAAGLGAAANRASALLAEWLGPRPLSALTILDHDGQPYQDGPLLVAPAATLQTSPEAPALVYSLSHAWVQTGQPWMDEGLAQFFALLWVEREHGRDAALSQLADLMQPVALAEPDIASAADVPPGQPLIAASDELFYRRKAAAVWWMLREITGEKALRGALGAWRTQPESQQPADAQAVAFQHLLERLSGKDLGSFFADWVLRDRGLPDLSITGLASSQTPAGAGHNTGWLVAVTLRNDGGAVADVPLTVRSGKFSTTQRVRIPGFAQITERVLVEAAPSEVVLNDGSTPELRSSVHSRAIDVHAQ